MKIPDSISLIVPTRNEEHIVGNNLKLINDYLSGLSDTYEIVISDYSEDRTPKIVKDLSEKYPIRYIPAGEKGIGTGIKAGIKSAEYNLLMVYPIDMSWDIACIQTSFQKILSNKRSIILGSRGCKESVVNRMKKRLIFTRMYNLLVNLFFDLKVSDTQCTAAFKRSEIIPFIDNLDSKTAFFQTQLLIYSKKNDLKIIEIPVVVNDTRGDSKVNLIQDSFSMLKDIIKEFYKLIINKNRSK